MAPSQTANSPSNTDSVTSASFPTTMTCDNYWNSMVGTEICVDGRDCGIGNSDEKAKHKLKINETINYTSNKETRYYNIYITERIISQNYYSAKILSISKRDTQFKKL